MPCLALPCRAVPCLALPCLALPCLALPCLALPCLALPCLALPCLALPCLALPCLALPCLALPCLALPCLALPCLALPCLAQSDCFYFFSAVVRLCFWPTNFSHFFRRSCQCCQAKVLAVLSQQIRNPWPPSSLYFSIDFPFRCYILNLSHTVTHWHDRLLRYLLVRLPKCVLVF